MITDTGISLIIPYTCINSSMSMIHHMAYVFMNANYIEMQA